MSLILTLYNLQGFTIILAVHCILMNYNIWGDLKYNILLHIIGSEQIKREGVGEYD